MIYPIFAIKTRSVMKKLASAFVVLLFVVFAFSSCKSTEDCPAYGQAETTTELPAQA
jgi:hypothetical protein